MSVSLHLRDAYAWHRQTGCIARLAFGRACIDVSKGVRRYPATGTTPAVLWQDEPGARGARLVFVEDPAKAGLRLVGEIGPEARRGAFGRRDGEGWLTDPFGDTFKDGTGLCWGVVYQLPGSQGAARFVAGYQIGGTDCGPMVDLGHVFTSSCSVGSSDPKDHDEARQAARVADAMAMRAAEAERDYQTAWQAGNRYSFTREELTVVRARLMATLRDMKASCAALQALPATIREAVRERLSADLAERRRLHARLARLAKGELSEEMSFYARDARLAAAFNEGAGEDVLAWARS